MATDVTHSTAAELAAAIRANLHDQGVAVNDVATVAATSGVAPIWVDGAGMNRIIIVPGANELVSAEAAAAAIERLRADPDRRSALGQAAAARAGHYSAERFVEGTLAVHAGVLAPAGAAAS